MREQKMAEFLGHSLPRLHEIADALELTAKDLYAPIN
jgi:hypothetical protein